MIGILKTLRDNEEQVMENILLSGSFCGRGNYSAFLFQSNYLSRGENS